MFWPGITVSLLTDSLPKPVGMGFVGATIGALRSGDAGVVVALGSSWAIGWSSGDDLMELPGAA